MHGDSSWLSELGTLHTFAENGRQAAHPDYAMEIALPNSILRFSAAKNLLAPVPHTFKLFKLFKFFKLFTPFAAFVPSPGAAPPPRHPATLPPCHHERSE